MQLFGMYSQEVRCVVWEGQVCCGRGKCVVGGASVLWEGASVLWEGQVCCVGGGKCGVGGAIFGTLIIPTYSVPSVFWCCVGVLCVVWVWCTILVNLLVPFQRKRVHPRFGTRSSNDPDLLDGCSSCCEEDLPRQYKSSE